MSRMDRIGLHEAMGPAQAALSRKLEQTSDQHRVWPRRLIAIGFLDGLESLRLRSSIVLLLPLRGDGAALATEASFRGPGGCVSSPAERRGAARPRCDS